MRAGLELVANITEPMRPAGGQLARAPRDLTPDIGRGVATLDRRIRDLIQQQGLELGRAI